MSPTKLLSLEEANERIPLLKSIAADIERTWKEVCKCYTDRDRLKRVFASSEEVLLESSDIDLKHHTKRLGEYIKEARELGCIVESLEEVIIAIPSLHLGRQISLCWKIGDEEIDFWHEVEESYREKSRIENFVQERLTK